MRALGYYLNSPSVRRRRYENAVLSNLSRLAFGSQLRHDLDRVEWALLATDLRSLADDIDALPSRLMEVAA